MSDWTQGMSTVSITQEVVDSSLSCSVCREDFTLGESVRKLVCSHLFHSSCIIPWVEHHSTCPVCRSKLSEDALSDIGDMTHIDDFSSVEYESIFDDISMDEVSSDDETGVVLPMDAADYNNNFLIQHSFFRQMESLLEPATELQGIFPSFIRDLNAQPAVIQSSLRRLEGNMREPLSNIQESPSRLTEGTSELFLEFQNSSQPTYEIEESLVRLTEDPLESISVFPGSFYRLTDESIDPLCGLDDFMYGLPEDTSVFEDSVYGVIEDPLQHLSSLLTEPPSGSQESLDRLSEDGIPPHSSHGSMEDFSLSFSVSSDCDFSIDFGL